MIIEETFELAADRSAVSSLLMDVERISRCIPGVEAVEPAGLGRYSATLRLRVGPIVTAFEGRLELDGGQAPDRLVARGWGADRQSGSQARVRFAADLEQLAADRTLVHAHADVAIRGRLGQFGTGVIRSTARELIASFAHCANASLRADEVAVTAPSAPPVLWRIALRGAIAWAGERLRGLWGRFALRRTPRRCRKAHKPVEEPADRPAPAAQARAPRPARPPRTVYVEPLTVADACAALAAHDGQARVISGGTAVVLMMRQGLIDPRVLVSLARVPLGGIERRGDHVRIGATTTLAEVARSRLVRDRLPSLSRACALVGNVRIRNVATLGGNLAEADYASDPPSVLASLGARCTVEGSDGVRTVAVRELITGFFTTCLQPHEIVTEILVPAPDVDRRAAYQKYVSRSSEDRPCVGVAVRGDFDGETVKALDVVVGAVAPTLQRFPHITQQAVGGPLDLERIRTIAAHYARVIEPMEDARGSAWYRRRMIEVFVGRALGDLRR